MIKIVFNNFNTILTLLIDKKFKKFFVDSIKSRRSSAVEHAAVD